MDFYRARLKTAQWDWLEGKFCNYHGRPRRKDRINGRAEKRRARNDERRALAAEGEGPNAAELRLIERDAKEPCSTR